MTSNHVPERVCVICLGNICRSPAAEYLLRHFAKQSTEKKIHEITFDSAGLWGGSGRMNHLSAEFLRERGINSSSFRSKGISRDYLESFDLIIVMEVYMIEDLLQEFPRGERDKLRKRVFTLTELVGGSGNIKDPYGMNRNSYFKILTDIENYCLTLIQKWEEDSE